jgi:hypothetical protein
MNKTCSKCKKQLSTDMFWKDKYKKDGFRSACKGCNANDKEYLRRYNIDNAEKMKQYREKNKKRLAESSKRWRENNPKRIEYLTFKHSIKKYNMSIQQYEFILELQNGVCAICLNEEPSGKRLAVDHDHSCCPGSESCGECVRGLLCSSCNNILGRAKDNISTLENAVQYLKDHLD